MNLDETKKLLGEVAVVDNRKMSMDAANTWHEYLAGFSLDQCREALKMHRQNAPDVWVMPGHLVSVMRRGLAFNRIPMCPHDIPRGSFCHDCTHPKNCQMCRILEPEQEDPEW